MLCCVCAKFFTLHMYLFNGLTNLVYHFKYYQLLPSRSTDITINYYAYALKTKHENIAIQVEKVPRLHD